MRKIPTVFVRDERDRRRVTRVVTPGCEWVFTDPDVRPTRKYDGTCVLYDEASLEWWARREVKPGKSAPPGFRGLETDPATGKTVGWEPIEQSSFWKAFQECDYMRHTDQQPRGTYELIGPKVNGNPEGVDGHQLVHHATAERLDVPARDFDALMEWLEDHPQYEGIVWHHEDGRMAKLKRRDVLAANSAVTRRGQVAGS